MWIIRSETEYGYWSNGYGWVYNVQLASKFFDDELELYPAHELAPDAVYVNDETAVDFDPELEP